MVYLLVKAVKYIYNSSRFKIFKIYFNFIKGFYNRSLKKHTSYKCFNDKNCNINKETRNICKACRFLKCEQVGMSIDSKN
jgi:hypothetical protein